MGGAAGHVSQIWEASDLTFKNLKDIINKSLKGELENITEKLDGQNILITYRNGKVLAARSTKHLKNFGEDAMDITDMKEFFSNRPPSIQRAFIAAMEDFQTYFENFTNILEEGKKWFNVEILYADTENIISYGVNQLRIHCIKELDKDGKTINISKDLENFIETSQKTFLIKKTNSVTIKIGDPNLTKELIYRLHALGMQDNNTIEDYVEYKILKYIRKNLKRSDEVFIRTLARRWGRGDKSTPINKLLKDQPEKIQLWIRDEDKKNKVRVDEIKEPLFYIFSDLGVSVLKNIEGLVAIDKNKSIDVIKNKLNKAIDDFKKIKKRDKKIIETLDQLEKLEKMGGICTIVPIEGIVFEFNDKLLKLTGSFTSVLRIIGFFKFI